MIKKESLLYTFAFLVDGCISVVWFCIPLLALRLGASYEDLGALGAIGSLAYALSCLLAGRLSDRVGYRSTIIYTCFLIVLVFSSYLVVSQVVHLLILGAITGVVVAGLWPPLQAWIGQGKEGRRLLHALSGYNISWSLGVLAGPVLGGLLYAVYPTGVFALCAALMGLLAIGLTVVRVREEEVPAAAASGPTSFPLARRFLPIAWIANFATFFSGGAIRALFPKLAGDLKISPELLGYLLGLIGVAQLVTFVVLARGGWWQFRWGPLAAIQLVGAGGLFLLAASQSPFILGVALLLHGLQAGVTFTASIFYSLYTRGGGGRRTGFHEAIIGSGFLFGPLLGGLAAEHIGSRSPYLLSAGVVFGGLALQYYFLKNSRGAG